MAECNPLLTRVKQVGAAIESTCGAGASFVAADFKLRPTSISAEIEMTPIEDETLSASLSPRKQAIGEKTVTVQVASTLAGSGVAATVPEHDVYLRGCGFKSEVLMKIAIGAITGGPFRPGEVVTQATSLATGRVMQAAYTGDGFLYVVVLSGTFNGTALITGGTSNATATATATAVAAGHAYHPRTSGQESIAIRVEEDGMYKLCNGAMGSATISSDSSGTPKIEYTFNGKLPTSGTGDAALTSNVTRFTTAYPVFQSALLALDRGAASEFSPVVRSVSVDLGNESTVRKDANDSSGLISSKITGRTPTITVTAESMKTASFDIFTKMANATSVTLGWRWTAPDNKVWLWGINGQITAAPGGDADGFSTNDLTFRMCGTTDAGDDELWIVFSV